MINKYTKTLRNLKQCLLCLFIVLSVKLLRDFSDIQYNVNIGVISYGRPSIHSETSSSKELRKPRSCKVEFETEVTPKPLIQLNPNKYLMPALVNGPNNQLRGFMDSIYAAIRLNRTLILPNFYKHRTEDDAHQNVPADIRIDVEKLSRLIPIVRDHHTVCKTFNVFLLTNRATHLYNKIGFRGIERKINGSILRIKKQTGSNRLEVLPKKKDDLYTTDKYLLRKAYKSDRKCALYVYPFNSALFKPDIGSLIDGIQMLKNNTRFNPEQLGNNELYALGEVSCQKPEFVKNIQSEFFQKIAPENGLVVAAQWRYDSADWMRRCAKQLRPGGKDWILQMCAKISDITAEDIAQSLFIFAQNMTQYSINPVKAVYLSAPLTIQDFISEVKTEFNKLCLKRNIRYLNIYTHKELEKEFVKFKGCPAVNSNWEDVLSSVEMTISVQAFAFLFSPSSSWSSFVRRERNTFGKGDFDQSVLNFVWETHVGVHGNLPLL